MTCRCLYIRNGKRCLDIILSIVAIILLTPVFLSLFIFLMIEHKGYSLFWQERVGKNGRIFIIYKFKTMHKIYKNTNETFKISKMNRFIRRLSLDELPQLFNVLFGTMSLVGPRPLITNYLPLYSKEQYLRHTVRPGITGWAQVNGRNAISWTRKFELDVYYVNHLTFFLDLKILWLTFLKVIKSEGINQSAQTTMQPFNGSN